MPMRDDLPTPARPLKIGTRGSPLALWQAHEVRRCLMAAVRQQLQGEVPALARHAAIDYTRAVPGSAVVQGAQDWRAAL